MQSENNKPIQAGDQPAQTGLAKWWNWKLGAALVLCGTCLIALLPTQGKAKVGAQGNSPSTAAPVAVSRVVREDLESEVTFDAEFRPYQDIDVYAKTVGFVTKMNVDVGDRVEAGQVLATLEIPELAENTEHALAVQRRSEEEVGRAEAEVLRAEAAYHEVHLAYTRLAATDKAQPHLIARQEIDTAQARDGSAQAALQTAKASVLAAKQQVRVAIADWKKLQREREYANLTAPFAGVIAKRYADPGDLIRGGLSPSTQAMPLVRLVQNQRLRLVFPVSISFVSQIKIGSPVRAHVESLSKTFSGTVSRFTREVQTSTRTMDAEVEVPNPDLRLIPGMYASVSLGLERRPRTLVVPVEAVSRQKTSTVFVVNQDNTIQERAIKLGLETPTKLEVLAGLNENDLVMIGSRSQFKAGQKVQPKLIDTPSAE